jgi:hypothetical protein
MSGAGEVPVSQAATGIDLDAVAVVLRRAAAAYQGDVAVWTLTHRIATDCEALAALLVRRALVAQNEAARN